MEKSQECKVHHVQVVMVYFPKSRVTLKSGKLCAKVEPKVRVNVM
jgi:hypothetical protein